MEIQHLVADGQLLVAALIALAAGVLSFLSPCVLPLVPGYLAYVGATAGGAQGASSERSGTGDGEGSSRDRSVGGDRAGAGVGVREKQRVRDDKRTRTVAGILLFVAGFSAVFVAMTALAGTVGAWLWRWEEPITRIMGAVVVVMGLVFVGLFSRMQRTAKLRLKPRVGLAGAPLLGIVFGVGWTPCMGPTLAVIMGLGMQAESTGRAAILGLAYCVGLGLPFVLAGFGFGWMAQTTSFMKRHIRAINLVGGGLLVLIGLLMLTGLWTRMMYAMQAVIGSFVTPL